MARTHAEPRAGAELQANVGRLERVRVIVVPTFAGAVELIAEEVVVPATQCARDAGKTMGGIEVSSVGAKAKFGSVGIACRAEHLHNAGHGVGTVERALGATSKLDPRDIAQWSGPEVHGAAGIVHRHAVDEPLVVTGIPAAHEQRGQATVLPRGVHDGASKE